MSRLEGASAAKEQGTRLFKEGKVAEAKEHYKRALQLLLAPPTPAQQMEQERGDEQSGRRRALEATLQTNLGACAMRLEVLNSPNCRLQHLQLLLWAMWYLAGGAAVAAAVRSLLYPPLVILRAA